MYTSFSTSERWCQTQSGLSKSPFQITNNLLIILVIKGVESSCVQLLQILVTAFNKITPPKLGFCNQAKLLFLAVKPKKMKMWYPFNFYFLIFSVYYPYTNNVHFEFIQNV